ACALVRRRFAHTSSAHFSTISHRPETGFQVLFVHVHQHASPYLPSNEPKFARQGALALILLQLQTIGDFFGSFLWRSHEFLMPHHNGLFEC
ncbi:MAG: hypothetical protein OES26_23595, partial [Gammaproteobacteria bacterium]|nr:hypothetical protein [Gammaproteobacteria bacterium]